MPTTFCYVADLERFVRIDGRRIPLRNIFVQNRVEPLRERFEMLLRQREDLFFQTEDYREEKSYNQIMALKAAIDRIDEQIKSLIDDYFSLQKQLWMRGVVDSDPQIMEKYGLMVLNGRETMVVIGLDGLTDDINSYNVSVFRKNRLSLAFLPSHLRAYYTQKMQESVLGREKFSRLYGRVFDASWWKSFVVPVPDVSDIDISEFHMHEIVKRSRQAKLDMLRRFFDSIERAEGLHLALYWAKLYLDTIYPEGTPAHGVVEGVYQCLTSEPDIFRSEGLLLDTMLAFVRESTAEGVLTSAEQYELAEDLIEFTLPDREIVLTSKSGGHALKWPSTQPTVEEADLSGLVSEGRLIVETHSEFYEEGREDIFKVLQPFEFDGIDSYRFRGQNLTYYYKIAQLVIERVIRERIQHLVTEGYTVVIVGLPRSGVPLLKIMMQALTDHVKTDAWQVLLTGESMRSSHLEIKRKNDNSKGLHYILVDSAIRSGKTSLTACEQLMVESGIPASDMTFVALLGEARGILALDKRVAEIDPEHAGKFCQLIGGLAHDGRLKKIYGDIGDRVHGWEEWLILWLERIKDENGQAEIEYELTLDKTTQNLYFQGRLDSRSSTLLLARNQRGEAVVLDVAADFFENYVWSRLQSVKERYGRLRIPDRIGYDSEHGVLAKSFIEGVSLETMIAEKASRIQYLRSREGLSPVTSFLLASLAEILKGVRSLFETIQILSEDKGSGEQDLWISVNPQDIRVAGDGSWYCTSVIAPWQRRSLSEKEVARDCALTLEYIIKRLFDFEQDLKLSESVYLNPSMAAAFGDSFRDLLSVIERAGKAEEGYKYFSDFSRALQNTGFEEAFEYHRKRYKGSSGSSKTGMTSFSGGHRDNKISRGPGRSPANTGPGVSLSRAVLVAASSLSLIASGLLLSGILQTILIFAGLGIAIVNIWYAARNKELLLHYG
ncbi:MAG: hypothetical protein GF375_07830, partial [Candidatus Omnitrophica bacterium]|nr:hypothetical protein [Candidatus Omnitrophota bacterium]MBD3269871.1 hypothetical protein [Candidatus Omnitrophota bacterium]